MQALIADTVQHGDRGEQMVRTETGIDFLVYASPQTSSAGSGIIVSDMHETGTDLALASDADEADRAVDAGRRNALLKTGALQNAILTSANFSIIATDEKGIIQLFNVGAERMLGYKAAEVVNRISPSDMHDPQEVTRARQCAESRTRDPDFARLRGVGIQGLARDRGRL